MIVIRPLGVHQPHRVQSSSPAWQRRRAVEGAGPAQPGSAALHTEREDMGWVRQAACTAMCPKKCAGVGGGGEEGLVVRGRAALTHFSGGDREMTASASSSTGLGTYPSSHIPDLARKLLTPSSATSSSYDCKRQQTLHGSFTPINQPDGQAVMGDRLSPNLCCPPWTPRLPAAPSHHPPKDSQDVPDTLSPLPNTWVGRMRHRTERCVPRVSRGGCRVAGAEALQGRPALGQEGVGQNDSAAALG